MLSRASRAPRPIESRVSEQEPLPPDDLPAAQPLNLDSLYQACADRLTRFFARRAGPEEALDLVHETFARLAGARASVVAPEAYANRIATNLLRDRARAAARRALAARSDGEADLSAISEDPHRLLEARERLVVLERAVQQLGARRRRIFLLHRVEGLTYAEIADEVGMSVKGVKKQMTKALIELRRAMGPFA